MIRRLRLRLHDLARAHYWFAQGDDHFFICAPRCRWQRPIEYVVALGGSDPITITREQFVNLDRRLRAETVVSLDEALEPLKPFENEENDDE